MLNITIPRFDDKCALCRKRHADKTGSHLVPNFLIHAAFSFDGKGPRDREIIEHHFMNEMDRLYTYYGPQVSPERVELGLGHPMTDEEIYDNRSPLMYDYLFCSECEKKFSIIESEYAAFYRGVKKTISPRIVYLFWLSVIWRMGVGRMSFFLDIDDEFTMRDILKDNLSLSAEEIVNSENDLGDFCYALWHSDQVRRDDICVFSSRCEHQPYMGLLSDTAILLFSRKPKEDEIFYGDITFKASMLNDWKNDISIEEVCRRWMLNIKDYLIDSSYDYFDPHREQALLLVREHERTYDRRVPTEIKEIAIKAKRVSVDPSIYFEKRMRLRKARRIFIGYFKQIDFQSKGIAYDPLQDEELALIPEDYTKYYYDLAKLETTGEDICKYPYVEEARKVVPKEFFHKESENILLNKYNEALEWFVEMNAETQNKHQHNR